jgi:hypothetical protein
MAKNNPLVEEALIQYAMPSTWYSLAKVFEIIANDMGQKENDKIQPRTAFAPRQKETARQR